MIRTVSVHFRRQLAVSKAFNHGKYCMTVLIGYRFWLKLLTGSRKLKRNSTRTCLIIIECGKILSPAVDAIRKVLNLCRRVFQKPFLIAVIVSLQTVSTIFYTRTRPCLNSLMYSSIIKSILPACSLYDLLLVTP